jgi:hypothetical protein
MSNVRKHVAVSSTAAVLLALVASVPAMAAAAATEVPNASFESLTSGKPDCWGATGGVSTFTAVGGHTGSVAVQLRGRPANTTPVEWRTNQDGGCGTAVTPGRVYTIGAWYQATSLVQPVVYTYSVASGWAKWFTGAPYSGSTPWNKIAATTPPVPKGTEQIGIGFVVDATTKLVLDDVTVDDATAILNPAGGRAPAMTTSFANDTGLVTNEYAYWNPTRKDAVPSSIWAMNSGSLFNRAGTGYTGKIDDGVPDAKSAVNTDSSTFRLQTVRNDFANVNVSFQLSVAQLTSTKRTPAIAYDGVHIWLRLQSEYSLYAASVARRDGRVVIKKKCPGGPSNDGTYYTLGKELAGSPITLLAWTQMSASVQNNADGTVTIVLSVAGKPLVSAVDTGVGCAAITKPGAVGIRGDNTRFSFKSFAVGNL